MALFGNRKKGNRMRVIKQRIISALVAAGLFLGAGSAVAYQMSYEPVTSHGTVYRVVDADTFIVNVSDSDAYRQLVQEAAGDEDRLRYLNDRFQSIRVRLANVDTPESVHRDESRNTQEGRDLSAQVKALLEGQPTQVTCYDWGHYGRAICTVMKPSGVDLGEWLIANGHSEYITAWGRNPFFDAEYRAAER